MDANENAIVHFATRVRQMIIQYRELLQKNQELGMMVAERDAKIGQLKARLAQAKNDYDSLKLARMVEVTDGDWEKAQKKLAKLIRDVDKCITLVSEN